MIHLIKHNSFLLLLCSFFFVSCYHSKKASITKQVEAAKILNEAENKKLAALDQKKNDKLNDEKINDTISLNISKKLDGYKLKSDSISAAINFIDSVLKTKNLFKANKTGIKNKLRIIDNYYKDSVKRVRRLEMIDEGLNIAEQHLFNLAAFFGPGKYEIPADKHSEAEKSFSPILDSFANFYTKFKDVDRFATLIVVGFADGTGFNKESATYKTLTALLNDSLATKEVINGKLSQLRAKNIANFMEVIFSQKIPDYKAVQKADFIFLESGKGESYPSKKITDYTPNDERRRIVLLFWNILPK